MARAIDGDLLADYIRKIDMPFEIKTTVLCTVNTMPTIDPVKHGKWIIDGDCTHCSECRDVFGCTIMGYFTPKHCPSCGARMDGE